MYETCLSLNRNLKQGNYRIEIDIFQLLMEYSLTEF